MPAAMAHPEQGRACGSAQPAAQPRFEQLTAFFDNEIAQRKIPGAVVLIQQHGRPIYQKCFGVRDVKTGAPMTADTIFALHSMTKPITSVAAMMLIEQGRLALTDPVASYIPAFANVQVGVETERDGQPLLAREPPRRPVTIEDLLRHTSGITYGYIGGELIKQAYTAADLFEEPLDNKVFADRIAELPLARQPGTLWRYGHSTDVLGRIIEIVTGRTLYQFAKQHIFDPLGMVDTRFVADAEQLPRMAAPLPDDLILQRAVAERLAHPGWQSGGGGLIATTTDYAKFAQMILDRGDGGGRRLLGEDAFRQMTTDQIGEGSGVGRDYFYFPGDGFGFGYGLAVRVAPGEANPPPPGSIGELKWDSGSGTFFGVDPKLGLVYVLMQQTQRERGRITKAFKQLVYDAMAR
jgi:CubicO group peptidase (beta-lactamase class C family)